MGTRSTTLFLSEWNEKKICNIYRQYDGYLSGHGAALKEFLFGGILVNGMKMGETRRTFNGMGCLAASVIAHFKTETGGFYMTDVDQEEGYHYTVYAGEVVPGTEDNYNSERYINLKVTGYGDQLFYDGPIDYFDPDMKEYDEEDEGDEVAEDEEEEELSLEDRLVVLEEKVDKIIEAL
jgi:hypothetical protein